MTHLEGAIAPAPDPLPVAGGNLAGIVRWAAEIYGQRSALRLENGEAFTFASLAARSMGLAQELQQRGVEPGSRVAVTLDNRSTFPLLIVAAAHLGASVLPLNPGYAPHELKNVLELVQPSHLVGLPDFCKRHRGALESIDLRVTPVDSALPWTDHPLIASDADYVELGTTNFLDSPVRFGLTSGSTGVPKAVVKTHWNWLMDGRALRSVMGIGSDDRVLSSQPLYYGDPFMLLMAGVQAGAETVILSRFRSQTFMENVARFGVTKFMTIGSMPAMLLNSPPSSHDRAHAAKGAWSVAVPRDRHAELEVRFGIAWMELYGSSEAGGVLGQTLEDHGELGEGWLGRPLPAQEIRLIDDAGNEVAGDGVGMLDVRGPTVVTEYWRRPDATAEAFSPGGWYRMGDVIERVDGKYRYLYRRKDIVRRAGENISCQEVEAAIREHGGVVDVAVMPIEDDIRGEEVWAMVQLSEELTQQDPRKMAENISETARQSLSRHKVPRFVSFVDNFPRTPTERIAKRQLSRPDEATLYDLGERRWAPSALDGSDRDDD